MRDMFGVEIEPPSTAKRKPTPKRGHANPPGTGPAGETCGSCEHLVRRRYAGTFMKCALTRAKWTKGPGSDVRARDAACNLWEAPSPTQERAG